MSNQKNDQDTKSSKESKNTGKYIGEYKDGKRHGQGVCTYPDGTIFKGTTAIFTGNGSFGSITNSGLTTLNGSVILGDKLEGYA